MKLRESVHEVLTIALLLAALAVVGGDTPDAKRSSYRSGLAAHYYQDPPYWGGNWTATLAPKVKAADWTFTKYAYTRVEPVVNHLFVRQGWFSVRWQGFLNTKVLGQEDREAKYDFRIWAEDGCRLYIDGKKLIDFWGNADSDKTSSHHRASITLAPNKRHRIIVEYFLGYNQKSRAQYPAKLYWACEARGIKEQIIPAAQLSHTVADLPPKPGRKN